MNERVRAGGVAQAGAGFGPSGALETDRPRVTAVVLNWCAESDSAACVSSLLESDYPALRVLLVDNGSPDGSGERLRARFAEIDFLQTGSNLGYTGGNNRGIEWAVARGADFVLLVNDDAVVERGCVSAMVGAARSGDDVGVVSPKILYYDAPDRVWFGGGDFSRVRAIGVHRAEGRRDDPDRDRGVEAITFVTGCCCLISSRVIRSVGSFREEYFAYLEDAELSLRVQEAGFKLLYQPAARVLHRVPVPGENAEPTPSQIRLRDRNRRLLAAAHYGLAGRLQFAAWFYSTRVAHLVRYASRRDWHRVRAVWDGAVGK